MVKDLVWLVLVSLFAGCASGTAVRIPKVQDPLDLRVESSMVLVKSRLPKGDAELGRYFRELLRGFKGELVIIDKDDLDAMEVLLYSWIGAKGAQDRLIDKYNRMEGR